MQQEELIAGLVAGFRDVPGGLLPLLHAVQDAIGFIPAASVPAIAVGLGLSRAEVHGVISFYHDFRSAPAGRHLLQLCRAEACQAVGGRDLEEYARRTLDIDFGETSADGGVTLEPVYCLGNCACGPSVRLDDAVYARVGPARLDELLAALVVEESS